MIKTYITVFSTPKPFTDPHIATIQRNAIRSWIELGEQVQVILVGDEPGLAIAARDLDVVHLPEVKCNSQGTPLVSSIFSLARDYSNSPLLAYVNADILLLPDFLATARRMADIKQGFLLVGRRWDLEVTAELDFASGWEETLRKDLVKRGRFHKPAGSDYFIFSRSCYQEIPDFAIGRAGWDNWMIYQALRKKWLAVDATDAITIIHQEHDYSHLPGGQTHHRVPETEENISLAGGREITRFSLLDLNHHFKDGKIRGRRWNAETLRRAIETYPLLVWNNYQATAKITSFFHHLKFKLRSSKV